MTIIKLLRENPKYIFFALIVILLILRIIPRGTGNLGYIALIDAMFQKEPPNELEKNIILDYYYNNESLDFLSLQSDFQQNALLFILSQEELSERVVLEFEQNPTSSIKPPIINDAIVWSYLDEATKEHPVDYKHLSSASALRPYDICINYQLRHHAITENNEDAVIQYTNLLKKFPIQAILPTDLRLLDCLSSTIPRLYSENIWHTATTQRVISFLVWQFPQKAAIESLLKNLILQYPDEPYWQFYLDEYYQRQNKLLQGINATENISTPDTSINTACINESELRLNTNSILVNENLIDDPFFEQPLHSMESPWNIGVYNGVHIEDGLYFINNNNLLNHFNGVRLLSLLTEKYDDGKQTYGELTGTPFSVDTQQYLIQIEYLTHAPISGSSFLLLHDSASTDSFDLLRTNLPDTNGQWQKFCFIVDGPTTTTSITPLIRNWGNGDLQVHFLTVTPLLNGKEN